MNKAQREMLKRVLKETEDVRNRPVGDVLSYCTPAKDLRKFFSLDRPYVSRTEWPSVSQGQGYYIVTVENPLNSTFDFVHVSIAFGLGFANQAQDVNGALAARDQSWPYLTTRSQSLPPLSTTSIRLDYEVPANVKMDTLHVGLGLLWWAVSDFWFQQRFWTYVPS
jgi:hypothetical protein